MPNRAEIILMALRQLGVVSNGEAASAEEYAFGGTVLDAVFEEFQQSQGIVLGFDLDDTPAGAFLPLSQMAAYEIAPHYGFPQPPRSAAIARLRAWAISDDRVKRADTDNDGLVSDEEAVADGYAVYY